MGRLRHGCWGMDAPAPYARRVFSGGGEMTQLRSANVDEATLSVNAELCHFAEQFRHRRMRLGVTQADVGEALAHLRPASIPLSQSTVCRFESMTLSCSNMRALRPSLEAWLEAAERERREDIGVEKLDTPGPAW